jgi:hypothetical protein
MEHHDKQYYARVVLDIPIDELNTRRIENITYNLSRVTVAWNRSDDFLQRAKTTWIRALYNSPDRAITEAIDHIIQQPSKFPPSLGEIMDVVKQRVKTLGLGSTHEAEHDYQLCPDCIQRDGYARTAMHFIWTDTKQHPRYTQGDYYVVTAMTICGCEGSIERLGATGTRLASHREMLARKDERIELLEWHRTAADLPTLTHKETMKPKEYTELQERKQNRTGNQPFSTVLNVLTNATPEQRESLFQSRTNND